MKPFTIVLFVILLAIGFALLLPVVKTISSTTTTSCGQFPIDEPQYEWPTQTRVALYVPSADMGSNVLNA